MSKVKVLCLCGGGIFGAIIAKFLTYVPKDFVNKIDVLSGCSIGGILTNAYASGADPEKVLHAFLQQGKQIFSKRLVAKINPLASPSYENQNLKKMIVQFCGDKKLKDINKLYPNLKTIIPTLNITDDQYVVFRNFVDSDDNIDLVTLSLMTSAAPTYFQGIQYKGKCYVDGGMIQVAPLLTTVTALKNRLGIDFKDMDVLNAESSSSGDVSIKELKAETVNAAASSSGDVILSGVCRSVNISASSSGDVEAKNLKANVVNANASSAGDITCHAVESLDVTTSSSGSVNYKGDPKHINYHPKKGLKKID